MAPLARTAVNVISGIFVAVFVAGTGFLLVSGRTWMESLGALFMLYLLDRLRSFRRADKNLSAMPEEGGVNVAEYLNPQAMNLLLASFDRARMFGGHPYFHLGKDLVERRDVKEALRRLDVPVKEFSSKLSEYLERSMATHVGEDELRSKVEKLAVTALAQAKSGQAREISAADLFAALGAAGDMEVTKLFDLFQITPGDLEKALIFSRFRSYSRFSRLPSSLGGFAGESYGIRHRFMNRAWTARPTPVLDNFGMDLTDMARAEKIGFLIGHGTEYERMVNILSRPNKPNVLLVGEAGAGKEAVISHLAYMIARDKVPSPLFDKRLVALDINSLVAGADQGELQRRIKSVFDEIIRAGNIILYIPDIHNLSRTAPSKELSAANTLLPLVVSNDFPTIGSSYPKEYKQLIETDSVFSSAFQVVPVEEVSEDEAERILVYDSMLLERVYKLEINYSAIRAAVQFAKRYFRDKLLPSSADDLLKEALSEVSRMGGKSVTGEEIEAVAERRARIPLHRAGTVEREQLLHLEETIHERFVDQETAVKAVSRALREYRSGLTRKGGPIGSFLFVGPTGVGKTELSKILSKIQFGSEQAMVRFDMSEYQDRGSVARFIGSPDGAISGALTDAVLERPYSLILLDEFEKAYPDILNLFLQVFDDGRLTDNLGRTVDFQNTVIIATSNAHSDFIKSELESGKSMDDVSDVFKDKLTDVFRPELLNRMTVVVFRNLSREDIVQIARYQIAELVDTLKTEKGIELEIPDDVVIKLAEWGYDPVFGARPLREVISEKLRGPLSEMILSSALDRGARVNAVIKGENITFATEG